MKKIVYKSVIANTFLWDGYIAITIFAFVLIKGKTAPQSIINHECTHARQWSELAILTGIITWFLMIIFNISAWWMLLSMVSFYALYVIEWIFKCILYGTKEAYHYISFEKEAELAENNDDYLENSNYFAWMKFV